MQMDTAAAAAAAAAAHAGAARVEPAALSQRMDAVLVSCMLHGFDARSFVCLCASSRAVQQRCSAALSSAPALSALLLRSVAATAGYGSSRAITALHWLLQQPTMRAAKVNLVSDQLLLLPRVPLAAAEALVRSGLRMQITPQQLAAAAAAGAEGCGVWLGAHHNMLVPRQIWGAALPMHVENACLRHPLPQWQVRPLELPPLLAVAVAALAGCATSAELEAATSNVLGLCSCHAARQLSAAAAEPMLQASLHVCSSHSFVANRSALRPCLLAVCDLATSCFAAAAAAAAAAAPAAAAAGFNTVLRLALQLRYTPCVTQLCREDWVQQQTSDPAVQGGLGTATDQ
uniref:Uncharacterized protein n=1 Tax=Tetradesmus obliquus TaxID=3088 RepID=A0A383W0I1_TETOB|eukprot:jgi/Sobl393_1/3983/SZX71195.1